jgi:hypothetical protein
MCKWLSYLLTLHQHLTPCRWADGSGNLHENALPECQLELIQSRVDAIFPDSERQPVPFWMDTLCIPVAEEYKPLRNKSIKMMRQIYGGAEAVLVLDASLQQFSLSSNTSETSLALFLSSWIHRLWTCQEAMLANKLYFWFKDGPLYNANFEQVVNKEKEANIEKGLHGSFQSVTHTAVLKALTTLKVVVDMKFGTPGLLLAPLADCIQQRTATRISDEAICSAMILDLETEDILAVEAKGVSEESIAEKRMEIFLKQMGTFPQGMIFHHNKRLRTEGYRWAPRTYMGLEARHLVGDVHNSSTSTFKGKGLSVQYPGFILENVPPDSGAKITVTMKHSEHRYGLQLFPEDTEGDGAGASYPWDSNTVYAVLLTRTVSSRNPSTGTDALVGILMDLAEVREEQSKRRRKGTLNMTVKVKCECRAHMEPLDLGLSTDQSMVELLAKEQKWRVH